MFLDISFEYDCSSEDFIFNGVFNAIKGPKWISYHTEKGKEFLQSHGLSAQLHERIKISYDKAEEIYKDFRNLKKLSGSMGGFYWSDRLHTSHL